MSFDVSDETRCPHHITFSCQHQLHLFDSDSLKNRFVDLLKSVHNRGLFLLFAYVVMPHHVHLLLQPEVPVQKVLTAIKRPFSYSALRYIKQSDLNIYQQLEISSGRNSNHRFWLKGGGYDHWVTKDESLHEIATYIQNNPVRWGLVDEPEEWKWSSAGFWISEDQTFPMDLFD
jgi:putative transposase